MTPRICWRPRWLLRRLGLDGFMAPMIGAVALGLDGNAISVAPTLAAAIRDKIDRRRVRSGRRPPGRSPRLSPSGAANGLPALRFAHVFPFSTHHYQLRLWMRLGGVDPEGVRLTVTPPPLMGESLRGGYVNGFCVGEPWNSLARDAGDGRNPPSLPGPDVRLPGKGSGLSRRRRARGPGTAARRRPRHSPRRALGRATRKTRRNSAA